MQKSASCLDKLFALLHSKLIPELPNLLIIVFDGLEGVKNFIGHVGVAEFDGSMEAVVAKNRHESRNKVGVDASSSTVFDPLIINFVVIKELRDHEVGSGVHLLLQVLDVILSARGLRVYLWVSGHSNTEEITVLLLDESDELRGVAKPVLYCSPLISSTRRVASECQDVSNVVLLGSLECLDHTLTSNVCASEMHEYVQPHVVDDVAT